MFQQENTEFRLCAETCMLQSCLKLYVSPTPTSQLSQSSLWADLAACAGAGRGTEPAAVCWHLHRHQPSSTPLSNLQDGAGRLAWQVWPPGRCAFKKGPVSERASKSWREIRDIIGTAVLGYRAARHTHRTGTDLNYFQIHFQTQVTWILVKTNTV